MVTDDNLLPVPSCESTLGETSTYPYDVCTQARSVVSTWTVLHYLPSGAHLGDMV